MIKLAGFHNGSHVAWEQFKHYGMQHVNLLLNLSIGTVRGLIFFMTLLMSMHCVLVIWLNYAQGTANPTWEHIRAFVDLTLSMIVLWDTLPKGWFIVERDFQDTSLLQTWCTTRLRLRRWAVRALFHLLALSSGMPGAPSDFEPVQLVYRYKVELMSLSMISLILSGVLLNQIHTWFKDVGELPHRKKDAILRDWGSTWNKLSGTAYFMACLLVMISHFTMASSFSFTTQQMASQIIRGAFPIILIILGYRVWFQRVERNIHVKQKGEKATEEEATSAQLENFDSFWSHGILTVILLMNSTTILPNSQSVDLFNAKSKSEIISVATIWLLWICIPIGWLIVLILQQRRLTDSFRSWFKRIDKHFYEYCKFHLPSFLWSMGVVCIAMALFLTLWSNSLEWFHSKAKSELTFFHDVEAVVEKVKGFASNVKAAMNEIKNIVSNQLQKIPCEARKILTGVAVVASFIPGASIITTAIDIGKKLVRFAFKILKMGARVLRIIQSMDKFLLKFKSVATLMNSVSKAKDILRVNVFLISPLLTSMVTLALIFYYRRQWAKAEKTVRTMTLEIFLAFFLANCLGGSVLYLFGHFMLKVTDDLNKGLPPKIIQVQYELLTGFYAALWAHFLSALGLFFIACYVVLHFARTVAQEKEEKEKQVISAPDPVQVLPHAAAVAADISTAGISVPTQSVGYGSSRAQRIQKREEALKRAKIVKMTQWILTCIILAFAVYHAHQATKSTWYTVNRELKPSIKSLRTWLPFFKTASEQTGDMDEEGSEECDLLENLMSFITNNLAFLKGLKDMFEEVGDKVKTFLKSLKPNITMPKLSWKVFFFYPVLGALCIAVHNLATANRGIQKTAAPRFLALYGFFVMLNAVATLIRIMGMMETGIKKMNVFHDVHFILEQGFYDITLSYLLSFVGILCSYIDNLFPILYDAGAIEGVEAMLKDESPPEIYPHIELTRQQCLVMGELTVPRMPPLAYSSSSTVILPEMDVKGPQKLVLGEW